MAMAVRFLALGASVCLGIVGAHAQEAVMPQGKVSAPASSTPQSISVGPMIAEAISDVTSVAGVKLVTRDETHDAFTNVLVFEPAAAVADPNPISPQVSTAIPNGETPASIACIYNVVPQTAGCNPKFVTTHATGGGGKGIIAIVDAYDDPNAADDLRAFSMHFGLGFDPGKFEKKYVANVVPPTDPTDGKGWEIETSLDIEWAHAMAPDAKIILVEAKSAGLDDMYDAVSLAKQVIAQNGGGEISLSWGGPEYSEVTSHDTDFSQGGAVYFAASGDHQTVIFPASSQYVVAVGGTSILRDANGNYLGEQPWENTGAGSSDFEKVPSYQSTVAAVGGVWRGVADIAAVADPRTGVLVYDSENANFAINQGWLVIGGTSAAAPIVAGIANASGQSFASGSAELNYIYGKIGTPAFKRPKEGKCGDKQQYSSDGVSWDFCTGVGMPNGLAGL